MSFDLISLPLSEIATFKYGKTIRKQDIEDAGLYPVHSGYTTVGYLPSYMYEEPQLMIVCRGAGGTGDIKMSPPKVSITNLAIVITCDESKVCKDYLYWVLKLADTYSLRTGSAQPQITINSLDSFNVVIHQDLSMQRSIADFLDKLDLKIGLNSQTNQTLEQMAQAIFKSWFVDFDPVKAKMNGELPEGMDAATASLFPEKLVESELGLIPEGWEAVQIGDIVERLKPKKRYTKKQVEPYGKTPVYEQGASILLGFHNDDAGFDASPEEPVFIFGDHTCITHLSCSKFDISSNVIPLKGSIRPTIWTYYAIQGKQEFQEYRRHWSEFIIKGVVLPPIELAEKYAELVTTNYLMMESLKRQSKELEQLRDTLLPKLLSGEIELGATEAMEPSLVSSPIEQYL
ncbi:TPA: restriction endonuclease subunit S [Vibrio vulnificus]